MVTSVQIHHERKNQGSREYEATYENVREAAWRLKREFTRPDDWQSDVYRWFSNHREHALEDTDDQGGWPKEDDHQAAFEARLSIGRMKQCTLCGGHLQKLRCSRQSGILEMPTRRNDVQSVHRQDSGSEEDGFVLDDNSSASLIRGKSCPLIQAHCFLLFRRNNLTTRTLSRELLAGGFPLVTNQADLIALKFLVASRFRYSFAIAEF